MKRVIAAALYRAAEWLHPSVVVQNIVHNNTYGCADGRECSLRILAGVTDGPEIECDSDARKVRVVYSGELLEGQTYRVEPSSMTLAQVAKRLVELQQRESP